MEDKDSKNLQDIKDWKQQVSWALSHYFEFITKNGIVHVRLQLWLWISESVSSVTQSCPTLCEPVDSRSRLPCPSLTPRTYWNSCPSHWWCHPTISSSVIPSFSCLQSFPASGSSPMSWFFTSGGQSIGVSASASVLPMNTHDWSPLGWTGWISLQSKGPSRVFSNTTVQKYQFFIVQLSL